MINTVAFILSVILAFVLGIIFTLLILYEPKNKRTNNKHKNPIIIEKTDRTLKSSNILLKISLWKMIIGFAPKDELGRYYTGVNGFVSDAFCRLGVENHTVNEQMALDKIASLDKELGEL